VLPERATAQVAGQFLPIFRLLYNRLNVYMRLPPGSRVRYLSLAFLHTLDRIIHEPNGRKVCSGRAAWRALAADLRQMWPNSRALSLLRRERRALWSTVRRGAPALCSAAGGTTIGRARCA
jgi:hypothetical protein